MRTFRGIIPNKKHEYIVGIDFGHGETAAAICPIQWDTNVLTDPEIISLDGNDKVMVSAIAKMDNDEYLIGNRVFTPSVLEKALSVKVCFKMKPENIAGDEESLMIEYMKKVYAVIRDRKSLELRGDDVERYFDFNHVVYIATPTGWNKAQKDIYAQMALKAGLPLADLTTESRAALVDMQKNPDSKISQRVDKGAVVIDMGSSTLDISYYNETLTKPQEWGYGCGASEIEKILFESEIENNPDYKELIDKYPISKDWVLFECRKIKHEYFKNPDNDDPYYSIDLGKKREFRGRICKIEYDKPYAITQLLKEKGLTDKSYYQLVKDELTDFRCNYIPNLPIYGVYLTGSASIMHFFKPLIMETWNLSGDCFSQDSDPALTIARGVAMVGRSEARIVEFSRQLERKKQEIFEVTPYPVFLSYFIDDLTYKLVRFLSKRMRSFRLSKVDCSMNDLIDGVKNDFYKDCSFGEIINNAYSKALNERLEEVNEILNDVIREFSPNMIIKKEYYKTNKTSFSSDFKVVDDVISNDILSKIKFWSFGDIIITVLYPFFILKWIFTFLSWANKTESQKQEEEQKAREELKCKKLSKSERMEIYNEYKSKALDIEVGIKKGISSEFVSHSMYEMINSEFRKAITQHININTQKATRLYED